MRQRIRPGERAKSAEVRMEQLEARAKMETQQDEGKKKTKASKSIQASALNNKLLAKSIYYAMHPGTYQNPYVPYFGYTVELTDGSIWSVSPSYAYMTKNWNPSHLVYITPNYSWFSGYSYYLTNQSIGQSVPVNLDLGPIAPGYGSFYTHWIASIDLFFHTIYLEDGTAWDMSLFDRNIIDEWVPGDVVIIGVNDGWASSSKPNILINVATLTYAAGSVIY